MSNYKFETLQLHVGQEQADPATDSRAVPIYQTTSYVFHNSAHAAARFGLTDAGNIYGRLTNSTQDVLEKRVAALEGGVAALALASGAAAITYTIEALAQKGDHIVAQKTIYGGSYNLLAHTLPLYGVDTTFVNAHDLAEVEGAIRPNTKAIYLETLGNPNSDIPDIDAVAAIAHKHGLPLVIDNTFGTPYWIRPIEHGADIVVHSATKFLGGHGTTLGGVIVDSGRFDWKASGKYAPIAEANPSYHGVSFVDAAGPAAFVTYIRAILLRDTGAAISPFNAFLLLQGVETLSLRLDRHAENTKKVVEYLARHPQVEKVNHPSLPDHPDHALYEKYFPNGGASIFTFDIKGGQAEAHKFIDSLEIFSLLANVADVKSLVIHPFTTTHSQLSPEELAAKPYLPPGREHWLGTDHVGRSVFARMVYGARISLAVGFGAALIAIFIGTAVGTMCGFFGGAFDLLTMRFAEMVACFPTFLLLLILMALFQNWKFQQSIPAVIAVIGLTGWIGVCQLVRGEVLKIRKLPYVESCFAAGIGNFRIMFVHILPNIAETVAVCFTFGVAGAIMAESTLSFLGFGVQPPTASWGGLLRQAYSNPFAYWHLTLIPGLAIFITISAFNFVSVSRRID